METPVQKQTVTAGKALNCNSVLTLDATDPAYSPFPEFPTKPIIFLELCIL